MGRSTFPPSLARGGNWPRFLPLCFFSSATFFRCAPTCRWNWIAHPHLHLCSCMQALNTSDGERLTPWGVQFCSPWSKPFDTFGLQCQGHPVAPHGGSARRAHLQNEFIAETQQPHVKWPLRWCGALSQKNNVPDVRPASATFSCSSWLVFSLSFVSQGSLGRKDSRHPGIASS
jgi:hypothetical protein